MSIIGRALGTQRKVQLIRDDKTVLEIDCTQTEQHKRESKPTQFPVEDGGTVGDHIILGNFGLTIEGIISDSPLSITSALLTTAVSRFIPPVSVIPSATALAAAQKLFSVISQSKSPSVKAYEQLLQLQSDKRGLDVITTLKRYSNMYIAGLSAPRAADTGQVLLFTLELQEIMIVSPQSVAVQIYKTGDLSAGEGNLGKQQKTSALVEQFKKGNADAKNLAGVGSG
jgi:hypothetical protein